MAALRHGIKTVIIPAANEKDLQEIDPLVRNALNFIAVEHVDSVISASLDFSKLTQPSAVQPEAQPAPLPLTPAKPARRKSGIRQ